MKCNALDSSAIYMQATRPQKEISCIRITLREMIRRFCDFLLDRRHFDDRDVGSEALEESFLFSRQSVNDQTGSNRIELHTKDPD